MTNANVGETVNRGSAKIAVVVNAGAGSAIEHRAKNLFASIDDPVKFVMAQNRNVFQELVSFTPSLIYLLDIGRAALPVMRYRRRTACRLLIDTGDRVGPLLHKQGRTLEAVAGQIVERLAWRTADAIVVRGRHMRPVVKREQLHWIPDGVDVRRFGFDPHSRFQVRSLLGLPTCGLVVGTVGTPKWSPVNKRTYDEEIVRLVAAFPDIHGVVVGGGDGLLRLRAMAEARGVRDRLRFVGQIPLDNLPAYLSAMDVVTSFQTDDAVGWSRTTGKLPEYLANGRILIASPIGEAVNLPNSVCVHLDPSHKAHRPDAFIEAFSEVRRKIGELSTTAAVVGPAIAREYFDYDLLRRRLCSLLFDVSRRRTVRPV